MLKHAEQHLEHASAAQLHALCAGGLWLGRPALAYHAAGRGLALSDPLAYRFLLARGQALSVSRAADGEDRARACLRAARELASRARDMDAVREASAALDTLPEWGMFDAMLTGMFSPPTETALTQEEIACIIECERQSRRTPQFTATPVPRSGVGQNHGDTGCHAGCWRTFFRSSRLTTNAAGAHSSMDPFTVLGIEETADDEAVRAAYVQALRASTDRDPEGFRRIRRRMKRSAMLKAA